MRNLICKFRLKKDFTGDTVEPLIKDTLNKGHLCIKDTFQCTNLCTYSGNAFLPRKVKPLIKDTLNKGHLCIKDTFQCTNLCTYSGNAFLPRKEDNLSIMSLSPP